MKKDKAQIRILSEIKSPSKNLPCIYVLTFRTSRLIRSWSSPRRMNNASHFSFYKIMLYRQIGCSVVSIRNTYECKKCNIHFLTTNRNASVTLHIPHHDRMSKHCRWIQTIHSATVNNARKQTTLKNNSEIRMYGSGPQQNTKTHHPC
jgi:hypothetical protein